MKCDPLYIPLPQERGKYVARGVNGRKDDCNMSLLPLSYRSPIGCQTDQDSTPEEEWLEIIESI